ncbi:MAG: prepilin peptidase [Gammaproteobacteria bacterium WSBS_2016_MAG_OTU1]
MIFAAVAGLFGLLLGSFYNVAIYRLPQITAAGIVDRGKSFFFLCLPLSYCPRCQTPIAPLCNIPVFSFLFLRGRANCCGAPISWCYPLVELSGGLIAVIAALHFGPGVDFALAYVFMSILLIASVIDMRKYYLLDILTIPLLWLGLLANLDSRFALLSDAVLGAVGGYLGMSILAIAGATIFKRTAMGGGDFKLMAALGAWLGWQPLPLLLFFACIIGITYAFLHFIIRQTKKRRSGRTKNIKLLRDFTYERFYFGPALSLAGVVMLLYGDEITSSYWLFIASGQL